MRDDKGYRNQIETYLHRNADARISHSICPDGTKRRYPDLSID